MKTHLSETLLNFVLQDFVLALQIVEDELLLKLHVFFKLPFLFLPNLCVKDGLFDGSDTGLNACNKK
jgi:hypothetical protein